MSSEITEEVLTKIYKVLTSYLRGKSRNSKTSDKIGIKSFSIESGCGKAENYLSAVYAIQATTISSNADDRITDIHDIILKSQILTRQPADDNEKYFWHAIFQKEYGIYSEIISQLEDLGKISIAPKIHHFYQEEEAYCCLVMQNLNSEGYKIAGDVLDFEEFKTFMKYLGKFHALSLVLEAKNGLPLPEKYEMCLELMYSKDLESVLGQFYKKGYAGIADGLAPSNPKLAERLRAINIWQRLCQSVQPGLTSFPCLCHGDPRPANLFFKKNETSNNMELKLIDFQLTRYASPVTDLLYAFYIGTTTEFRANHLEALLKIYFLEFKNILTSFPELEGRINLNAWNWTFDLLLKEFKENYMFGFLVAIVLLPLTLTEAEKKIRMRDTSDQELIFRNWQKFITECFLKNTNEMGNRVMEIIDEMIEKNVL